MTDNAGLKAAPNETEQDSGDLKPQAWTCNCSHIKKAIDEVKSLAGHSSQCIANDTLQTTKDETELVAEDAGSQTGVRNRSHLTKPMNDFESSHTSSNGAETATPEETNHSSGESDSQNGVQNRSHSTKPMNEVGFPEIPHKDDVGRRTSNLALELCNQLRTELTQEFSHHLQRVLENAVDRILEHSEAENLMDNSMWLKSK